MKKLVALVSVLALTLPVFAQGTKSVRQVNKKQQLSRRANKPQTKLEAVKLKRYLAQAVTQDMAQAMQVTPAQKEVLKELVAFEKAAYTHQYYEYDVMFQLMDNLRVSYMKLHEATPEEAGKVAQALDSHNIKIANGERQITVTNYIKMETVNLYPTEQEKFEAFLQAVEEDKK